VDTVESARIAAGVALAREFSIKGTPGVIVNGWRYPRPPSEQQLVGLISSLLREQRNQGAISSR
jgi:protein-disulfide isomerase